MIFRRAPKNQWDQVGKYLALALGVRGEVTAVKPGDPSATDQPFEVEYDLTRAGFLDWSSKKDKLDLPLPSFHLPAADADKEEGSKPIELGSPTEITYRLKLSLPARYQTHLPVPVKVNRDYAEYLSTYKLEGSTLVAERILRLRPARNPGGAHAGLHGFSGFGACPTRRKPLQSKPTSQAHPRSRTR